MKLFTASPYLLILFCLVISVKVFANEQYVIHHSTFIGGEGTDDCDTVTIDHSGNTLLGCHSTSRYLANKKLNRFNHKGGMDAFVIKINKHSNNIDFITQLGGDEWDGVQGLATDASGNIYAVGSTYSSNFPTSANAQQIKFAGKSDAFLVKLNQHGEIIWSTLFGGAEDEDGRNLVLDDHGNIHIIGRTNSKDLTVTEDAIQPDLAGQTDAFIASFTPQGRLLFSSYLGGKGYDKGFDIKLLSSGKKALVGSTDSIDFPVKNAIYHHPFGQEDMFVVLLNDKNNQIEFATYIGGAGIDTGVSIIIDSQDNILAVGQTHSPNMSGGHHIQKKRLKGKSDVFIVKINSKTHTLTNLDYLGGSGIDRPRNALVDDSDNIIIIGQTNSEALHLNDSVTAKPLGIWGDIKQYFKTYFDDNYDNGFIIKLDNNGSQVLLSAVLGGDKTDVFEGAVIDKHNMLTVTGLSNSHNFETIKPLQSEFKGGRFDIILMKIKL